MLSRILLLLLIISCHFSVYSQLNKPIQKAKKSADDIYSAKPVQSDYFTTDDYDPYDYEDIFRKGLEKLEKENYRGAIGNFKKSIEVYDDNYKKPDDAFLSDVKDIRPEIAIAYCYNQLNDYDSAIDYLNLGIEHFPFDVSVYNLLAYTYLLKADTHIVKYNNYRDDKDFRSSKIEKEKIDSYRNKAISTLEQSLKINDKNPQTLHSLAYIYYLKNDISTTMKTLNLNMKINPDYLRSYNLKALLILRNGNVTRTNLIYNKAIKINNTNPNAYFMRGIYYLKLNLLLKARNDFESALRLEGDSMLGNFLIAFIDFYRGNSQDGLKHLFEIYRGGDYLKESEEDKKDWFPSLAHKEILREALNLSLTPREELILGNYERDNFLENWSYPGYNKNVKENLEGIDSTLLWKKCLLLYQYKSEPADIKLEMIEDIIQKEPKSSFRIMKAILLFENEKFSEALEEFSKLSKEDSDLKMLHFYSAQAHMELKDYKEAISEFDLCLDIDGTDEGSMIDKAICYYRMGFHEKAINDLMTYRTSKDFYRKSWVHESLGRIYMDKWEIDSAYDFLNKSIQENRKFAYPYVHKGDYLFKMGSFSYAAKQYLEALDRDGNLIEALEGIADSYMNLKDYEKAKGYYSKCSRLKGLNPEYRIKLAICFEKMENEDKAQAQYEKAKELINQNILLEKLEGEAYFDIGDFKNAIIKFEEALKKDSTKEEIIILLAKSYYRNGDYNNSINTTLRIMKKSKYYFESQLLKGINNFCLKNFEQADSIFFEFAKRPGLTLKTKNEVKGLIYRLSNEEEYKARAKDMITKYF